MQPEDILPDHLRPGLKIVFCGTAAGTASALERAYYAGSGNLFWPTLHDVGLTKCRLSPQDFALLHDDGIGLTDVAKRTFGSDKSLSTADYDLAALLNRIDVCSPIIVAFNGKKAASVVLKRRTRDIHYGLQENLGKSQVFVLPSTSGAARKYWDKTYWHELGRLAQQDVI